jgi:hypothetical protein
MRLVHSNRGKVPSEGQRSLWVCISSTLSLACVHASHSFAPYVVAPCHRIEPAVLHDWVHVIFCLVLWPPAFFEEARQLHCGICIRDNTPSNLEETRALPCLRCFNQCSCAIRDIMDERFLHGIGKPNCAEHIFRGTQIHACDMFPRCKLWG